MTHHIVVVGGGYAGLTAARRLARRTRARVTLVNTTSRFVERIRLHQVAAGQRLPELELRDLLRGTDVELVVGRVTAIDPEGRRALVGEARELAYHTLVYAVGSVADPGAAGHALSVATADDAIATGRRVARVAAAEGTLAVVGGGATGLETATELAETYPGLRVRLIAGEAPGAHLSISARRHLHRTFDRMGIDVHTGHHVAEVRADALVLANGEIMTVDAAVWAGGLGVPELARRSGLAVDGRGRVTVDRTLRSISHPDVYAVGDAAAMLGSDGAVLRMACSTALMAGTQVADMITARLAGREPYLFWNRYAVQSFSLGRKDGLVQPVHRDDSPYEFAVTGRSAALTRERIARGAVWTASHFGIPFHGVQGERRASPLR